MFQSIRTRLWLSYALLIVIALSIVAAVLAAFLIRNPYIYRQTTIRLGAAQQLLGSDARNAARIEVVAQALDVRVLVVTPEGALSSDSAPGLPALRLPAPDRVLRNVESVRDVDGKVWLLVGNRLQDGNWLLVAAPRPRLLPALGLIRDEVWRPLMQGGLLALGLALILAYLLARWIASPMQELIGAAHAVEAGRGSEEETASASALNLRERGPREVRELTRAFKSMLERVRASQRSQKDFVANLSHELRTPLTSIQGFSQAIIDGTAATPEARRQAAEIIHEEAGRMHRMAVDLLALARLDAGTADLRMETMDAARVLEDVVASLQPMAASCKVELNIGPLDGPLQIVGDEERMAQVFTNLLDNALKYTPAGGKVTVNGTRQSGEVQISVSDTGPGIPSAELPHIFERFRRADSARSGGKAGGAGLGLAIAREITEAHGGRITVRSVLGHGAQFVVHLPPLEGSRRQRGAA